MNRETRDKFASGTDQTDLTTGNACWQTAPLVFAKLNRDFGPFDIDLTADANRHLCAKWFGPQSPVGEFNALTAQWPHHGSSGFSNPPYGPFVQHMLRVAKHQASACEFASTLLLPMRVTTAFKAHVLQGAAELLFCDRRLVFFEHGAPRINQKAWEKKGQLRADPAMFDSILVRYLPGIRSDAYPKLGVWQVPPHVTTEDLERARPATSPAVPVLDQEAHK